MKSESGSSRTWGPGRLGGSASIIALVGAFAAIPAALAQQAAPPAAQAERRISLNIPAQSLNGAVLAFADKAGIQVFYDAARVRGLRSNGATGEFTVPDALARILAGTGVTYRFTGASSVALETTAQSGGDPDVTQLDTVVVEGQGGESAYGPVEGYVATRSSTGTKTDTPILVTPQSISVVGAEEMEARNVETVEDAIKYMPGIYLPYGATGDSRGNWINIRGFQTTELFLNGMVLRGVNWAHIDPSLIERVEVARGPASVLYGQGIPGGMVNVVGKRPQELFSAEVATEYGSFDWKRIEGDITGPLNDEGQWLYRFTAALQDSDGPNGLDHDRNDRTVIAPSLTWRPSSDTTLSLLVDYQDGRNNAWNPRTRYDTPLGSTGPKLYLGEPDFDSYRAEQTNVTLLAEHAFNDAFKVSSSARYTNWNVDYYQYWPLGIAADGRTLSRYIYSLTDETDVFTLDTHGEARASLLGMDHLLIAGIDYSYLDRLHGFGADPGSELDVFDPDYGDIEAAPGQTFTRDKQRALGLYAQDQIEIGAGWSIQAGGRQDYVTTSTRNVDGSGLTSTQDDAFTWRLGVVYETDFGLVPYVSYAESFEPQSGTDRNGNPFEPTTGRQYEIGLKYQPPGIDALATLALFDLRKQNALTPDPANNIFNIQTGEIRSRGVELGLTLGLDDGLNMVAAYTYNPMEVTKSKTPSEIGRQLYDQPIHTASLWLDYRVQEGSLAGLGFGGGLRYASGTRDYTGATRTGDSVMDEAMVRYDFEDWGLALNARNLLDREVDYGCTSAGDAIMCYVQEPRTVTARLTRKF